MSDFHQAAHFYARLGWRVFPVIPRQKTPAIKEWQHRATAEPETINVWWRARAMNIGLACGPESGIVVIDVDQHDADGRATLVVKAKRFGALPTAPEQRTGSGGGQLFFRYPPQGTIRNSAGKLGPGLDVRGVGGYVVLPPSIHPCGEPYRWIAWPHVVSAPLLPQRWLDLLIHKPRPKIAVPVAPLRRTGQEIVDRLLGQIRKQQTGMRHCTLYAAASDFYEKQASGLIPPGDYAPDLVQAGLDAGLPPGEAQRVVSDARRAHGR